MTKIKSLQILAVSASTLFISLFSGCATQPLTLNYSPSSTLTAEGSIAVSSFTYSAANGGKIKSNQIRNTAIGNAYFEKDIAKAFEEAVFKELRFVGVRLDSSKIELTGDVEEFLMDDLGYSVDWTLRVKYRVKEKAGGAVVYEATKAIKKKTEKFGNLFGIINEIIKMNIEELIKDDKFKNLIKGA
ncbi:MAG TPA: hypothetical protein VGI63_00675 [Verrucomicrobiae bacterium]